MSTSLVSAPRFFCDCAGRSRPAVAIPPPATTFLGSNANPSSATATGFNRIRHGKHSRIDNPDDLPEKAIEWCLQRAGLGWRDLTAIGYSFDPAARLEASRSLPDEARVLPGDWGTDEGEEVFFRHNLHAREKLVALAPQASFSFLGHHLCHAASAYLVSPFDEAALLVVDGIGEIGSTWLGLDSGCELRELETAAYPHSVGFVWEKLSEFLGFDAYGGPGKVMGYACITDPRGELSGRDYLAALAGLDCACHEEWRAEIAHGRARAKG